MPITPRRWMAAASIAGVAMLSASTVSGARTRPAPKVQSITIAAVGDTMLGSMPTMPADPIAYLAPIRPALTANSQIVFGNLEGVLDDSPTAKAKCIAGSDGCYAFRSPTSFAADLHKVGFTVLNDANNHILDFGPAGETSTVDALHRAGVAQTGLPGEITTVVVKKTKVAFVAFAPYAGINDMLDIPKARALIKHASTVAKLVIVYMHAGAEGVAADHVTGQEEHFLGEDRGNPEAFAHMAIDVGADLVLASGPHTLRGMEIYKGHLIAYSLGDFANYGNFSISGSLSMSAILRVTLSTKGALTAARVIPVTLAGAGRPAVGGGSVAMIAHLSQEDFGSRAARFKADGTVVIARK